MLPISSRLISTLSVDERKDFEDKIGSWQVLIDNIFSNLSIRPLLPKKMENYSELALAFIWGKIDLARKLIEKGALLQNYEEELLVIGILFGTERQLDLVEGLYESFSIKTRFIVARLLPDEEEAFLFRLWTAGDSLTKIILALQKTAWALPLFYKESTEEQIKILKLCLSIPLFSPFLATCWEGLGSKVKNYRDEWTHASWRDRARFYKRSNVITFLEKSGWEEKEIESPSRMSTLKFKDGVALKKELEEAPLEIKGLILSEIQLEYEALILSNWDELGLEEKTRIFCRYDLTLSLARTLFRKESEGSQIALLRALQDRKEEKVFIALWREASSRVKTYQREETHASWVHTAILLKQKKIIRSLIKEGFNICVVDKEWQSPLSLIEISATRKAFVGADLLKKLRLADNGFTHDLLLCRLLGEHFSLPGRFFEGMYEAQIPILVNQAVRSLEACKGSTPLFSETSTLRMVQTIRESLQDSSKILAQKAQKKVAMVKAGWKGHTTAVFSIRNYFWILIDTSIEEDVERKGIQAFTSSMRDKNLARKVIKTLLKNREASPQAGYLYFHKTISQKLKLKPLFASDIKQTVGNCTWSTYRAAIYALLCLKAYKVTRKSSDVIRFETLAKESLAEFDKRDQCLILAETLPILKKYPFLFDLEAVYESLLATFIQKPHEGVLILMREAPELITKEHGGWTIMETVWEDKRMDLFVPLLLEHFEKLRDFEQNKLINSCRETSARLKKFRKFLIQTESSYTPQQETLLSDFKKKIEAL